MFRSAYFFRKHAMRGILASASFSLRGAHGLFSNSSFLSSWAIFGMSTSGAARCWKTTERDFYSLHIPHLLVLFGCLRLWFVFLKQWLWEALIAGREKHCVVGVGRTFPRRVKCAVLGEWSDLEADFLSEKILPENEVLKVCLANISIWWLWK